MDGPRDTAQQAADRFLEYYEQIRRLHREGTGSDLTEYKPTEPDRLVEVFNRMLRSPLRGLDLLAEFMHTLVWSQCLGNANHRTTILFLQGTLKEKLQLSLPHYVDEPDANDRFMVAVNNFSDLSHRLLDRQSEFGFNPDQLRQRHKELTREWLQRQLGDQSRVATTIGPQRLMTASS